ncbi:hypothetical protein Tco_0549193 [Tanacetum coccineum]
MPLAINGQGAAIQNLLLNSLGPHKSSPSLSLPDLPLRKRYRGMFELVEDSEEDKEIEESMDSNSVSEDAEDEGPTVEDEILQQEDEGHAEVVRAPCRMNERHGSADGSHRLTDEVHTMPATAETEGFLTELGAQVEMHGGLIHDHVVQLEDLSPALFERYDRDIGELFTRSGQLGMRFSPRGIVRSTESAQKHAISDMHGDNQDLRLQLTVERRVEKLEWWFGQDIDNDEEEDEEGEGGIMSSYTHPSIPSDYDVKDAFSSINAPNYILTSPGYSLVTPGNTSPDSSDDLTKYLLASLALSPFHDDPIYEGHASI